MGMLIDYWWRYKQITSEKSLVLSSEDEDRHTLRPNNSIPAYTTQRDLWTCSSRMDAVFSRK